MYKQILTLTALLLFASAAWAQTGTVAGIVMFADSTPVPNALVLLDTYPDGMHGHHYTTTTNAIGVFHFEEVEAGQYDISVGLPMRPPVHQIIQVHEGHTTTVVLMFSGDPLQVGSVSGLVIFGNRQPAEHAVVNLDGQEGPHHGFHAMTLTNEIGLFHFENVPVGSYQIAALLAMHGFAGAQIEVAPNQNTNVTLILDDSSGHGHGDNDGHHFGDTLTVVDLAGRAIVLDPDSTHRLIRYFLDVDEDGTPDYRLAFGPPWYNPDSSSAERPVNGDQITIHGGLLTYANPPIVVVYEVNGLFWRRQFLGHGGYGGGDHHRNGCNPDSVVRIELTGTSVLDRCIGFHDDFSYAVDVDSNGTPDYYLDFGAPDYDPGNGAARPDNGQPVFIVGGLINCDHELICNQHIDRPNIVIVYEINGLFWRQPGDTLGLGPDLITGVSEPTYLGAPSSYLLAKNFPNPFNPTTTIAYSTPVAGNVKLSVFDITGREVATLVNSHLDAGSYSVAWDGSRFASGIYFYRVTVGKLSYTNRMVLIK